MKDEKEVSIHIDQAALKVKGARSWSRAILGAEVDGFSSSKSVEIELGRTSA
jgi:hypothetical protein